jgi:hypothetical protein
VGEGDLGLTRAVQVNSLVSTFDDENPDTRQTGATFFSGIPVPMEIPVPRPRVRPRVRIENVYLLPFTLK